MTKWLWFHAFRRNSIGEIVDVLTNGPRTHPDPATPTQRNERELGLTASVYAYLGKTIELFGTVAFTLVDSALDGTLSPFDTGGLLAHTVPVSDWPQERQRQFLVANSWPTDRLAQLVADYPGNTVDLVTSYLDGERPLQSGPAAIWRSQPPAPIWRQPENDWRQWTWEGRTPDMLPLNNSDLVCWTCTPDIHVQVFDHLVATLHPQAAELLEKYYEGGVSPMVRELRARQM